MADIDLFIPESFWGALFGSDDVIQNPFPHFRSLGDGPQCSHAAASAALRDPRFGVAGAAGDDRPLWNTFNRWLIQRDPPEHTAIRRLFSRAFTKSAVDAYRPFVEATVASLLDELVPRGSMNLLTDFAFKLPTSVIAELMGLSDASREGLDELLIDLDLAFVFQTQLEYVERGDRAIVELSRRLDAELHARRENPGDDLLSRLVRGEDGSLDVDITHEDLVANAVLLLQAGHDTTMNTLTSGVYMLLTHPDEYARLHADRSLVPSAVEEFLRYNSAIGIAPRRANADVELQQGTVRAGSEIPFFLGALNRDATVFDDPDRFDVAREPNPHLAFAAGIHLCVGAPLARLELQSALAAILERLPNLRMVEAPRWTGVLPFRGLDKLLVEWG